MMNTENVLVIIPTYNEKDNIQKLVRDIYGLNPTVHILVVDDNSPDGTSAIVKQLKSEFKNLFLLERQGKLGLGTAYIAGFKFALQNGYQFIFEMDADYSHDPKEIPCFLEAIKDADIVIGSRYCNGVNVVNWPLSRLVLSIFANRYTRFITGLPLHDSTGGYKCLRREVLQAINLDKISSGGYSFQIEMNFKAWKKGFRLKEIPIIFIDRTIGQSKMSKKIVREAVWMVWKLKLRSLVGSLG
jgi:dolichol-phosphate mannosyltransferase